MSRDGPTLAPPRATRGKRGEADGELPLPRPADAAADVAFTNPMEDERIPRRRRSQEVAERLEQLIRSGRYPVGSVLPPERALMERFGVGRPAVREALYALQKMGLVQVGSGERPRVIEPTPEVLIRELSGAARHFLAQPHGMQEFQAARLFFEVGLARHAARFATRQDIRRLKRALDLNRLTLHDDAEFCRTDIEFHFVLVSIARNSIFRAIYEAMVGWLQDQMSVTSRLENANAVAFRQHAEICAAVAAKDVDRAEEAVRAHLGHVSALYRQAEKTTSGT